MKTARRWRRTKMASNIALLTVTSSRHNLNRSHSSIIKKYLLLIWHLFWTGLAQSTDNESLKPGRLRQDKKVLDFLLWWLKFLTPPSWADF